jgi:hypothetical protein
LIPLPASLTPDDWRDLKSDALEEQLAEYAEKAYTEKRNS